MRADRDFRHRAGAVAVLVALSALIVADVARSLNASIDEPAWITSSALTVRLVTSLAPPSRWEQAYDEQSLGDWGNKNPPLGKILIGVPVLLAARTSDSLHYFWQSPHRYDYQLEHGNIPPPHLLLVARATVALFATATLVLTYLLARRLVSSGWAAATAPFFLYLTPAFASHAAHVYLDAPQLCFLALALLLFCSNGSGRYVAGLVVAGLATAIKFSSAPLVIGAALVSLFSPLPWRARLVRAGLAAIVPFAVFVAVNPYLYDAPIRKSLALVSAWHVTKVAQQNDPIIADDAIHSALEGGAMVVQRGILETSYQQLTQSTLWELMKHFAGWLLTLAIIAAVAAIVLQRRRLTTDRRALALIAGSLLLGLFLDRLTPFNVSAPGYCSLAGIAALVVALRTRAASPPLLAFAILAFVLDVFTALWLPIDWARYYLPVLLTTAVIQAEGLALFFRITERRAV